MIKNLSPKENSSNLKAKTNIKHNKKNECKLTILMLEQEK